MFYLESRIAKSVMVQIISIDASPFRCPAGRSHQLSSRAIAELIPQEFLRYHANIQSLSKAFQIPTLIGS